MKPVICTIDQNMTLTFLEELNSNLSLEETSLVQSSRSTSVPILFYYHKPKKEFLEMDVLL